MRLRYKSYLSFTFARLTTLTKIHRRKTGAANGGEGTQMFQFQTDEIEDEHLRWRSWRFNTTMLKSSDWMAGWLAGQPLTSCGFSSVQHWLARVVALACSQGGWQDLLRLCVCVRAYVCVCPANWQPLVCCICPSWPLCCWKRKTSQTTSCPKLNATLSELGFLLFPFCSFPTSFWLMQPSPGSDVNLTF